MKIAVITSTRADFGLLKNLIIKLKKNFNCKVVGSGTHFSNYYGNTYKEIITGNKGRSVSKIGNVS